jgi:hypothetical protein
MLLQFREILILEGFGEAWLPKIFFFRVLFAGFAGKQHQK